MLRKTSALAVMLAMTVASTYTLAADNGLKPGTLELQSAGSLAFGPAGVLFVADPQAAAVFAVDTKQTAGNPDDVSLNIEGIQGKIAALLGTSPRQILVNDLAVNPSNGHVFLSVSRGRGADAEPVLLQVDAKGKLSEFSLKNVPFAKATFNNAPGKDAKDRRGRSQRRESITDLEFADGRLLVAGISTEEFASKLRVIPFPFSSIDNGTSVEIFHSSHGKFETRSPIRTFTQYVIAGEPHVLAAYTCTPLVKFPLAQLRPGSKLRGITVAELGNRNRPLDMFVYEKGGRDFILMANDRRGIMKVATDKIGDIEGIETKIPGKDTAGLSYETIEGLEGVVQLDRLNRDNAIVLVEANPGVLHLQTVALP